MDGLKIGDLIDQGAVYRKRIRYLIRIKFFTDSGIIIKKLNSPSPPPHSRTSKTNIFVQPW